MAGMAFQEARCHLPTSSIVMYCGGRPCHICDHFGGSAQVTFLGPGTNRFVSALYFRKDLPTSSSLLAYRSL